MATILAMVFKLTEWVQQWWQRLRGYKLIEKVFKGGKFVNGIEETQNLKITPVKYKLTFAVGIKVVLQYWLSHHNESAFLKNGQLFSVQRRG